MNHFIKQLVCIIKQGQSSSMEAEFSSSSGANKWENLPNNVLFHIFSFMSMFDVVMNVSGVCKSLRIASADPTLYKTLDLTLFTTKFRFHPRFLAWSMKDQLSTRFMLFLNNVLNVDRCGNFTKIILDSCTFLNDDHLIFIAQRYISFAVWENLLQTIPVFVKLKKKKKIHNKTLSKYTQNKNIKKKT